MGESGGSGHPCLVAEPGGKAQLLTVSTVLAMGLSCMTCIMYRYTSSISTLLEAFLSCVDVELCQMPSLHLLGVAI